MLALRFGEWISAKRFANAVQNDHIELGEAFYRTLDVTDQATHLGVIQKTAFFCEAMQNRAMQASIRRVECGLAGLQRQYTGQPGQPLFDLYIHSVTDLFGFAAQSDHREFMPKVLIFNKPFGVLTQFRAKEDAVTLSEFITQPDFYPAGRLDKDSEGLLILTNDGNLQHRITDPKHKLPKTYWVQVEGIPDQTALLALRDGVDLKDGRTRPARARLIDEPAQLWPRQPPIRTRQSIPTRWLELTIREGRNRQVRRMTAAVGLPTLRLIRAAIGPIRLDGLETGKTRWEDWPETAEFENKSARTARNAASLQDRSAQRRGQRQYRRNKRSR